MAQGSKLIVVFYDPDTRRIWGKGGKFASLDEFAKYPPATQGDVIPPADSESIADPPAVRAQLGPVIKCIDNREYICFEARCYATGRAC